CAGGGGPRPSGGGSAGRSKEPTAPPALRSGGARVYHPAMPTPAPSPIVITTWPFGLPANAVAWDVLAAGGAALDAVERGVTQCEFNTDVDSVGLGGLPDAAGEVTLDASIMDDRGRCGAVAGMRRVVNAV